MGGNEEQEKGHMIMEVVTVDTRVNELLNYINKIFNTCNNGSI